MWVGGGGPPNYFIWTWPENISRHIFIFMGPGTIIGSALSYMSL